MQVIADLTRHIANLRNHQPALTALRDALRHLADACDARIGYMQAVVHDDDDAAGIEKARYQWQLRRAEYAVSEHPDASGVPAEAGAEDSVEASEPPPGCPMHSKH